MAHPLTKEEIEKAKQKQRAIISDCDKAMADCQNNITTLNSAIVQQSALKKLAQDTLQDLGDDFPVVASTTTASGNPEAESIIDSSLIGSTALLVGQRLKIRPDTPDEDSADIVEFNEGKGEVIVGKPFKGGQVPKGVPYKVLDLIPSSEVA